MTPRHYFIALTLGGVLLLNGCQHCCKRSTGPACPTGGPSGPTGGPPTLLPPQGIPIDPPPRTGMRPEVLMPTPTPPGTSRYVPAPAPPSKVILGEPEFNVPAAAVEEKDASVRTPPATPTPPDPFDEMPAPVGIANFAQVKDKVSTGVRPKLDGLDWLKSKGYKSVLFLRNSNEDDSSDRLQVEKRGLKYLSLTVAPGTIGPVLVNEFNRQVNDGGGQPIYVYDFDGKRAGVMWYLYFRTSESLSDEEARQRAARFGLKEQADAEQTQLWTAVQKYLAERNP